MNEVIGQNVEIPEEVRQTIQSYRGVIKIEAVEGVIKIIRVTVDIARNIIPIPTSINDWKIVAVLDGVVEDDIPITESEVVDTIPTRTPDSILESADIVDGEPESLNESVSAVTRAEPKTDDELRALAMDITDDKVFTDRHLRENEIPMLGQVFMPIIFMDPAEFKRISKDIGMIYEYNKEAGPRAINGLPLFMSCKFLSKEECTRIAPFIHEIHEFKQKYKKKIPTTEGKTQ